MKARYLKTLVICLPILAVGTFFNNCGQVTSNIKGVDDALSSSEAASYPESLKIETKILHSAPKNRATTSLALGRRIQFVAIGTFENGSSADVTGSVKWSLDTTDFAEISNDPGSKGLLWLTKQLGQFNVIAEGKGGASYVYPFEITQAVLDSIEVPLSTVSLAKGTSLDLTVMGLYTDKSLVDISTQVNATSRDLLVANVSATATQLRIIGEDEGVTTVLLALNGVQKVINVIVTAANLLSIEINPSPIVLAKGLMQAFTGLGHFSDGTTQDITSQLTWSSLDNATVEYVSGSQFLAKEIGSTQVRALYPATNIEALANVSVSAISLQAIQINPQNLAIPRGLTQQLQAIAIFSDGSNLNITNSVNWSSSDNLILSVNDTTEKGKAIALSLGTVQVTATHVASGVSQTVPVIVTDIVLVSLAIIQQAVTINLGSTLAFTVAGTYSDNSVVALTNQVTWASSDYNIASISNTIPTNGLAAGLAYGVTQIQATHVASGLSATSNLTVTNVNPNLLSISIQPNPVILPVGGVIQLAALGLYDDGSTQNINNLVTWSSSNSIIVSVSNLPANKGQVLGVNLGPAVVSVLEPLSGKSAMVSVSVSTAVLQSLRIDPANQSIPLGRTANFTATGVYSDGSQINLTSSVTWTSSDPSVATINANSGVAASLAIGTTQINILDPISRLTAATQLTVTPVSIISFKIGPVNPVVILGSGLQLSAVAVYSDGSEVDFTNNVDWSSGSVNVATVNNSISKGYVNSVSQGSSVIRIDHQASGLFMTINLSVSPLQIISLAIQPLQGAMALGSTLKFNAIATYTDSSQQDVSNLVTWESSNPTVAIVNSSGNTQSLTQGRTVIIATTSNNIQAFAQLDVLAQNLVGIAINPINNAIAAGGLFQYDLIGTYTDGTTVNLTASATWTSSNPAIADFNGLIPGKVSGNNYGLTTITAAFASFSVTASLTVSTAASLSLTGSGSFPTTVVGSSSSRLYTLLNTGGVSANNLTVSGLNGVWQISPLPPACSNLQSGSSCSFTVVFSPIGQTTYNDTILVNYNNGVTHIYSDPSLDISGAGVEPANITFTSGNTNLGDTVLGQSKTENIFVRNSGNSIASSISFSTSAPEFTVLPGDCGVSLSAGSTCYFQVRFTPVSAGAKAATLYANYSNGFTTVNLDALTTVTASGSLAGTVYRSSGNPAFGAVALGTSKLVTFEFLSNNNDVTVSNFNLTGSNKFTLDASSVCTTISTTMASKCRISVNFSSTLIAQQAGTLNINYFDGASNKSYQLDLTGSGSNPCAAGLQFVNGVCWRLSASGQSCVDACGSRTNVDLDTVRTIGRTSSDPSPPPNSKLVACNQVIQAFSLPAVVFGEIANNNSLGCTDTLWLAKSTTAYSSSHPGVRRACSCFSDQP